MKLLGTFMVPHPPLIIPEIGKGREDEVKKTINSYEEIARKIGELSPDTIIISSPHAPYFKDFFYLPSGKYAKGSFSNFGAKEVSFDLKYDELLIDEIEKIANDKNFPCGRIDNNEGLDHGSMVPLYFIKKYLSNFKIVVIGLSDLSLESNFEMGKIVKESLDNLDRKVVYIASGDLSHKLQEYGPYGFAKEGPIYDEKIIDVMSNGRFNELLEFGLDFLDKAAECGHRSFIMMSGVLDGLKVKPNFYSHEDVTGVGYGIISYDIIDPYVELARKTIYEYINNNQVIEVPDDLPKEMLNNKNGAFVSIHEDGNLRGCIGTILPTCEFVAKEIINNAISAATKDPRFDPVDSSELDHLEINVDVLSELELVNDYKELDPKKYGVVVSSGFKRGVLLPDLEGVDTIDEQIRIAKEKAGITDLEDIILQKFEVIRHK